MPSTPPAQKIKTAQTAQPAQSQQTAQSQQPAQPDLVLFKFDSCPYCRRVAMVINELQLDIPTRDTRQEFSAQDELYEKTGRTQVPCLFIDGQPMFESLDIINWLRDNASSINGMTAPL